MTSRAPLPAAVRRWAAGRLTGLVTVTNVSWPREDSRVWYVASDTAAAYVKLSPTVDDFTREVYCYQHAARSLAPHAAPRLLAADQGLRAILTSPLPGRVVRGLLLAPDVERRVHELAGRLLRCWHDYPEPTPTTAHTDVKASFMTQAEEATECLKRVGDHLSRAEWSLVHQVSRELPELADSLPIVFCHGDYSPRNWLWDEENARCGLIDFEASGHDVAVKDLVWLRGAVWPTRRDLQEAFLGWVRPRTDRGRGACPAPPHRASWRVVPDDGYCQRQSCACGTRPSGTCGPGQQLLTADVPYAQRMTHASAVTGLRQ